jgi:hypothetical protein
VQLVLLAGFLVSLVLLMKRPPRLAAEQAASPAEQAANAESFQVKLGELEQAHANGQSGVETHITAQEVGAAIAATNPQPVAAPQTPANPETPAALNQQTSVSPDQVPVKDEQVVFDGDQVKGQFTTQIARKDVVVTFSGKLGSKDGYVDFIPTSFQVGSMPIPTSLVQEAFQKKLANDPASRDKLKLPDFVSDVKIENGQLVLVEK